MKYKLVTQSRQLIHEGELKSFDEFPQILIFENRYFIDTQTMIQSVRIFIEAFAYKLID